MPLPTQGFPIWSLTNGTKISFWWENDAQGIWFIYRPPNSPSPDFTGGGLFFQCSAVYINNIGKGPQEYAKVCIAKLNAKIRELWPELFADGGSVPTQPFPDSMNIDSETIEFAEVLANLKLVNNQLVGG